METQHTLTRSDTLTYGMGIAIFLTLYFSLMNAFGLAHHTEFRLFNWIIIMAGVYLRLKDFKEGNHAGKTYLKALGLGTATAALGIGVFSLFFMIYLVIDGNFMHLLRQNSPFGNYLNPLTLAFVVLMEGLIAGFMSAFMVNQLLKPAGRHD